MLNENFQSDSNQDHASENLSLTRDQHTEGFSEKNAAETDAEGDESNGADRDQHQRERE